MMTKTFLSAIFLATILGLSACGGGSSSSSSGAIIDDDTGDNGSGDNNNGGSDDNDNSGGSDDNDNSGGSDDNDNSGGSDDNDNSGGSDDNDNSGGSDDNDNSGGSDDDNSGGSDDDNSGGSDDDNSGGSDDNDNSSGSDDDNSSGSDDTACTNADGSTADLAQSDDNAGNPAPDDDSDLPSEITVTGQTYPYCASADDDPDGDGWGWTGSESCVVRNSAPDHQGDGSATVSVIAISDQTLSDKPINCNADAITVTVYQYLKSVYGQKIISGQQDLTWADSTDMYERVINDTGKAPAIMGYDFMNYTQASGNGQGQTEEAIEHWGRGGLVTFAWHWRDPSDNTEGFYSESYSGEGSKKTPFMIPMDGNSLDTSSTAFQQMEEDVDLIAEELQKLENAGVPVLWRPIHEAAGNWFWWGSNNDPKAFIALWRYLYDRFTNHHKLDNLIWVWNGQSGSLYPGDKYVDIASMDIYGTAQDYSSRSSPFAQTQNFAGGKKLVALSENGNIPDPDNIAADNAWWLYFTTWNDGSGGEGVSNSNNFWTGEHWNTNAHKSHVYNHELVITLDELPDFTP